LPTGKATRNSKNTRRPKVTERKTGIEVKKYSVEPAEKLWSKADSLEKTILSKRARVWKLKLRGQKMSWGHKITPKRLRGANREENQKEDTEAI